MTDPWKVSLHGGHSSAYCDHAGSSLRDLLEAAVRFGYATFGVTEHAPRVEPERLYAEELALGWDVSHLDRLFQAYAAELRQLAREFAPRLEVLCGFEAEVVPTDRYAEVMRGYRDRFAFDYLAGSVHWVNGHIIDYTPAHFQQALTRSGSLEQLAIDYYRTLAEMAQSLQPEVIGHFDLIRRNAPSEESVSTPRIRAAAGEALEAARAAACILDVNTAGYRKGLGRPYPAPWLVTLARDMGLGFCFGDDSHRVAEVGAGLEDARRYLLELGVPEITTLRKTATGLEQTRVPL